MSRGNKILAIGGNAEVLAAVADRLVLRGHAVERLVAAEACIQRFGADGADLVVVCLPIDGAGGQDLVARLQQIDPRVQVIITGTDHQIVSAAEAFKVGAFEHVEDGKRDLNDLMAAVGASLGSRQGDAQLRYRLQREAQGASWSALVGRSEKMNAVVDVVKRVVHRTTRGAPPTILLLGETGTGKGLMAKCIHYNGIRRNQTFVELNCAAIPAALLESELFGHERGAFTDAKASRQGLFETAHLGTLFLDEIGSLTLDLQAKLLTALEEKRIRRIGGRHDIHVDVQIIAAGHTDLPSRAVKGSFRSDLFHRLNVVSVTIPPLRVRGEDIVLLAEEFLEHHCRQYGIPKLTLSEEALGYIRSYAWPGNVRELKNQIERLVLIGTDEMIGASDFDRPSLPPPSERAPRSTRMPPPPPGVAEFEALGLGLDEVERELIRRALTRYEGNVSRAARALKTSRQTLMYRIKKHGL